MIFYANFMLLCFLSFLWLNVCPHTLVSSSDDIVERYDNLSKSVSDRNEKLQVTLTRSLSVQDGLDEMVDWMGRVEENLGKKDYVPLDSASIGNALSKEAVCYP